MPSTSPARISVWSDYVCPFCYLELPVLDRLQAEHAEEVEIDWRAFELRPEPAPTLDPNGEYLHRVWNQSVYPMAEQRGMVLRLPPVQPRSGISGVPALLINVGERGILISGAQPYEVIERALEQALKPA